MVANFEYSLRFAIDRHNWSNQKLRQLLKFCQTGKIDNVCFFINPEELNQGHLTFAHTDEWLAAIYPVSLALAKIGVTTSLNPWTTLMHSDRGTVINPELGFKTMVDYHGTVASSIACPADQKWQDYIVKTYRRYAKLQPVDLWLEDDFRHYNHTPIKSGCFCEHHMNLYNEQLVTPLSRAEFVGQLLSPGPPTPARKAYLNVARAEMIAVAHKIKAAVKEVSPQTRVGLMSSFPDWHATEGRDWQGLFDVLAGDGQRLSRPHLPAYNEVSPLRYARDFECYTRVTAAYAGDQAVIYPELENYMYSPYAKSKRFTQFQIESALLSGANGILLNLFDMIGNGIDESFGYAEILSESKPLLNKLVARSIQRQSNAGIQVLVNQDAAYQLHTSDGRDFSELRPDESEWLSLLGAFGFSVSPLPLVTTELPSHQVVAISGQLLRGLTDLQIRKLFCQNFMIIDGVTAAILIDRNLGALIGAQSGCWIPARTGKQSYEAFDDYEVAGVQAPRISMLQHIGDYYRMQYIDQTTVKTYSRAYTANNQVVGPVTVVVNNQVLILPIAGDQKYGWEAEYHTIKAQMMQRILAQQMNVSYVVNMPDVKLVLQERQILLSNFSSDNFEKLQLKLPRTWQRATYEINTRARQHQIVTCDWRDDIGTIKLPLPALATISLTF